MNGHKVFKTPLIPVIMMIAGLNGILGDLLLAAVVGSGLYTVVVWVEQLF